MTLVKQFVSAAWLTSIIENRNHRIDFIRGISIALILFMHYSLFFPSHPLLISQDFWSATQTNGYLGVSIFFVISGFLITTMSLSRYRQLADMKLKEFYVFRFSRIMPGLLLLTLINIAGYLSGMAFFKVDSMPRLLNYVFTFRFNLYYQTENPPLPWAILWSLAIEEVFYFLFPLICKLFRRHLPIVIALFLVALGGPLYRSMHGMLGLYDYLGCFDQIALGCITAIIVWDFRLQERRASTLWTLRAGGFLWMVVVYYSMDVHQAYVWAPTLIAIGAAFFLAGSVSARARAMPGFFLRGINLLGALSYELYLFHMIGFFLLSHLLLRRALPDWLNAFDLYFIPISVFLACVCGALYYYLLDPARASLRRLLLRNQKQVFAKEIT